MPIILQYIYTLILILYKYSIHVPLWFNFSSDIKWNTNLILAGQDNEELFLHLI